MNSAPTVPAQPAVTTRGGLDPEQYEEGWNGLMAHFNTVPAREYLTYHKRRFYELFDHLASYLHGKPSPRVLEIGVGPFTRLYKVFFPHIHLVTVDRPVALYGFDAAYALDECATDEHYGIDLNQESIGPEHGNPPLGLFDYVIFTEILEHLILNHVQLFSELLSLLAPNGLLYLTTPNFFSLFHLQQLAVFDNPVGVFPRRGENQAAGVHFREYTMLELIDSLTQTGGEIVKAYFSDCWDEPSTASGPERTPQNRSDLMVVACRPGAEIVRNADVAQWREYAKPAGLALAPDNLLQVEIIQLRQQVRAYESGRFMRLLKWLHTHGLPHF